MQIPICVGVFTLTSVPKPKPDCQTGFIPSDCAEMRFAHSTTRALFKRRRKLMCIVLSSRHPLSTPASPHLLPRAILSTITFIAPHLDVCAYTDVTRGDPRPSGYWKLTKLPERQKDYRIALISAQVSHSVCVCVCKEVCFIPPATSRESREYSWVVNGLSEAGARLRIWGCLLLFRGWEWFFFFFTAKDNLNDSRKKHNIWHLNVS